MSILTDPAMAPLFRALATVCAAERFEPLDDYDVLFLVPDEDDLFGLREVVVPGDLFDELEKGRRWIEVLGDEVLLTQSGKHWCDRWCAAQGKAAKGAPKRKRRAVSWKGARRT